MRSQHHSTKFVRAALRLGVFLFGLGLFPGLATAQQRVIEFLEDPNDVTNDVGFLAESTPIRLDGSSFSDEIWPSTMAPRCRISRARYSSG